MGPHAFTVVAWTDRFGTFAGELKKKFEAGQDVSSEILEGLHIIDRSLEVARGREKVSLRETRHAIAAAGTTAKKVELILDPALAELMARCDPRDDLQICPEEFPLWVDRERGRSGRQGEQHGADGGSGQDVAEEMHAQQNARRRHAESAKEQGGGQVRIVGTEGGVGGLRREVAIVGLDQTPLADSMAPDLVANDDDTPHRLVARNHGERARGIGRNLGQHFGSKPREDLALAWMACEGVQELRVGEADADRFHLHQDLMRARNRHCLGAVVNRSPGVDDLDRVLGGGNARRVRAGSVQASVPHYRSITWPPVTGTAWPVSYFWATT